MAPESPPPSALSLRDVVALSGRFPLLAGVDLQVGVGETVLIEGPNGAGKTSLLRVAAGLVPVGSGRATGPGLGPAPHRADGRVPVQAGRADSPPEQRSRRGVGATRPSAPHRTGKPPGGPTPGGGPGGVG